MEEDEKFNYIHRKIPLRRLQAATFSILFPLPSPSTYFSLFSSYSLTRDCFRTMRSASNNLPHYNRFLYVTFDFPLPRRTQYLTSILVSRSGALTPDYPESILSCFVYGKNDRRHLYSMRSCIIYIWHVQNHFKSIFK